VGTAQSLRSFQLKRQRSIGAQLSPDLIDALDRKGKGEVFRQPLRLDGSARFRKVQGRYREGTGKVATSP
jgi:hypothetical protein